MELLDSVDYKYKEVIDKYVEACSVNENEWNNNLSFYNKKYGDLNISVLNSYHISKHYDTFLDSDLPCLLGYKYYDIDGNGIQELLLGIYGTEIVIFDIYAFDGKNAVRIFKEDEKSTSYSSYGVYSNGVIAKYPFYMTGVEYYVFAGSKCTVEKTSEVDIDELLRFQPLSLYEQWSVLAKDIDDAGG